MIRLIAAVDRHRGIAKQGFQPWKIPEDEAYFAELTKSYGGLVLVGSTTYKSFGKPLTDRINYVLTSDKTPLEGAQVVNNLEKFLREHGSGDLWVIGGANVYSQIFEAGLADEVYITNIEADFGCNQFFPKFEDGYNLTSQSELHEQNGFIFSYLIYAKNQ